MRHETGDIERGERLGGDRVADQLHRVGADQDLVRLRRLLGRYYLFENDLVVPVTDPDGLLRDIEEAMPKPDPGTAPARRRRRR